jgi:hypothetical protein
MAVLHGKLPMIEKPKRQKSSSPFVIGIFVLLVLCTATIIVLTLLGPVLPEVLPPDGMELYDSCEVSITDEIGIRIQVYTYSIASSVQHYEITRDTGTTWNRFHTFSPGSGAWKSNCLSINSLNDQFIYLIPASDRDDSLFVTHNGGVTWHQWAVSDIEEYPVGFRCNSIEEVSFQDMTYGGMQVGCSRYDGDTFLRRQTINLFTGDGGITWALTYE